MFLVFFVQFFGVEFHACFFLSELVKNTLNDWTSYNYKGECPLYSNSIGFINHLEKLGWKHVIKCDETYLKDNDIAMQTMKNYEKYLELRGKDN